MRLRPVRQWLTVEPYDAPEKMGALYVPGNVNAQYRRGKIVDVPTKPTEETEGYQVGDIVVYDNIGTIQFRIGNKTFHALKGREIIGVLEGAEE